LKEEEQEEGKRKKKKKDEEKREKKKMCSRQTLREARAAFGRISDNFSLRNWFKLVVIELEELELGQ
jgi:hypothetical protein